jgi:hypothetical protein
VLASVVRRLLDQEVEGILGGVEVRFRLRGGLGLGSGSLTLCVLASVVRRLLDQEVEGILGGVEVRFRLRGGLGLGLGLRVV